jgi:histidine ammonia-lyase
VVVQRTQIDRLVLNPTSFTLNPGHLSWQQLRATHAGPLRVTLSAETRANVARGAEAVATLVKRGEPLYGINTGFGKLASTFIPADQLEALQRNLVLSHSAGVGANMRDDVVRVLLLLKIASLARGYSGVRVEILDALLALLNHDVLPCIPEKGSVGASGDLAPLAHMTAVLMGLGEASVPHQNARRVVGAIDALKIAGIAPITLAAKEGLALLNGTQASTALALHGLFAIEDVYSAAVVAGAMSVDAAMGSDTPFDPRIHEVRGHRGQIDVAAQYRALLSGSVIRQSHVHDDGKVQDPYSLRCQPQVMGAVLDVMRQVSTTLIIESNGVTDNPLVFADTLDVLSGGNFHAEPVAFAADQLAIVASEIGALSERRISLLVDPTLSGLPPFLVKESGLNSGYMIAQVTAAALASENKSIAHPASVDSLPTSANQEDHVSMATFAARRLADIANNTAGIVAIELLTAAQGIDLRLPLKTSQTLQHAHAIVRASVPFYAQDRLLSPDIRVITEMIEAGQFQRFTPGLFAE